MKKLNNLSHIVFRFIIAMMDGVLFCSAIAVNSRVSSQVSFQLKLTALKSKKYLNCSFIGCIPGVVTILQFAKGGMNKLLDVVVKNRILAFTLVGFYFVLGVTLGRSSTFLHVIFPGHGIFWAIVVKVEIFLFSSKACLTRVRGQTLAIGSFF